MYSNDNINAELSRLLGLGDNVPVKGAKPQGMDFSLIFFSDINQQMAHKYQLVFDLCEFADSNGFCAAWLPERHFHPFGGIYPNPSVLASAIAVKTNKLRLRSGSVVLPLHHPVEIVEAWSMVDNLSNGRVDLGVACGWNPNDFLLSPQTFDDKRQVWFDRIKEIQALWRGEEKTYLNGAGKQATVKVYPKPIQPELDIWLAVTKSDEHFAYAGANGYHVLTMLQGIDLDKLGEKIAIYRQARQDNGLNPDEGKITLMLHTLVHEDIDKVKAAVKEPFFNYIKSAMTGHLQARSGTSLTEQEINKTVEYSYERYFKTGALFGSVDDAMQVVNKAKEVGVNEIACLMDFGVDYQLVMSSLPYLKQVVVQSSAVVVY